MAISRHGKIDQAAYVGYSNLEVRSQVDARSVFRIGSVTKQFTAQAVILLYQQNKLDLASKLSVYFPDFPRANEITLKNLLQHSSGLPDFSSMSEFYTNQDTDWTPQQLVALIQNQPLKFDPGTSAEYCNTNYLFLGLIVEQVSGKSFADFIKDDLCSPLKLTRSRVGSNQDLILGRVNPYGYDGAGSFQNAPYVSVVAPFGTGNIMSTARDLVDLMGNLRKGKSTLFSDAIIEEIKNPTYLNDGSLFVDTKRHPGYDMTFGYGLELVRATGNQDWIMTKGGSITGFRAFTAYFPTADIAIAVTGNSGTDHFAFVMRLAERLKIPMK